MHFTTIIILNIFKKLTSARSKISINKNLNNYTKKNHIIVSKKNKKKSLIWFNVDTIHQKL